VSLVRRNSQIFPFERFTGTRAKRRKEGVKEAEVSPITSMLKGELQACNRKKYALSKA